MLTVRCPCRRALRGFRDCYLVVEQELWVALADSAVD